MTKRLAKRKRRVRNRGLLDYPLRKVLSHGVIGAGIPSNPLRSRVRLECGHVLILDRILPPRKRMRCDECPKGPGRPVGLAERWFGLAGGRTAATRAVWSIIERLYDRAGHHTLRHVGECLDLLHALRPGGTHPSVEYSLWLHDVSHDPLDPACVARSAETADILLRGIWMPAETVDRTRRLIMATAEEPPFAFRDDDKEDALLVRDVDRAILGAGRDRYDEYAQLLREEYPNASDKEFAGGRSEFLRSLLDNGGWGGPIFQTPTLRQKLESRAKSNIRRELRRLEE